MSEQEYIPARRDPPPDGPEPRGFFSSLRFPKLFLAAVLLFALDMLLPDFVPFIDEILLGIAALWLGNLKKSVRNAIREPD